MPSYNRDAARVLAPEPDPIIDGAMVPIQALLWGISAALIARLCRVHLDTARRWKRTGKMPRGVARLLELKLNGELGLVDTAWRGFRLVRGELLTPEGDTIKPGDVRAIPFRRQQLDTLQRLALEPKQWELFDRD